jgi:hypothetical protein
MKRRVNIASPISATNCTAQFIHLFLPPHLISIPIHISIFALLHQKSTYKRDCKTVPKVIVVDTMVGRTEGQVVRGRGVELHTAHVRLCLFKQKI